MKTITVGALNVVMPVPHNAQRYVDLFQKAFKLKNPVKLRGDFAGMLGSCHIQEVDGKNIVTGDFYKFFDLNLSGQWFNTLEQKQAEEDELAQINIPEFLKPHFQVFQFVFFPKNHRLFWIAKDQQDGFSPGQAQKLLSSIFDEFKLVREFGEIEVTIEPSTESLQLILGMPRLKRLSIEVSPPNPDDLDEAERKLFEKMNNQNANRIVTVLVAKGSEGLAPDDETKMLAEIAKSNGHVSGHGENEEGQTIDVSTSEHPMLEKTEYDPNTESRSEALLTKSRDLLSIIVRKSRDLLNAH